MVETAECQRFHTLQRAWRHTREPLILEVAQELRLSGATGVDAVDYPSDGQDGGQTVVPELPGDFPGALSLNW